jgi:hypothetical protein
MRSREFADAVSTCRTDGQIIKYYIDRQAYNMVVKGYRNLSKLSIVDGEVMVRLLRRIRRCDFLQKTSARKDPARLKGSMYHVHYDIQTQQRDDTSSEDEDSSDESGLDEVTTDSD